MALYFIHIILWTVVIILGIHCFLIMKIPVPPQKKHKKILEEEPLDIREQIDKNKQKKHGKLDKISLLSTIPYKLSKAAAKYAYTDIDFEKYYDSDDLTRIRDNDSNDYDFESFGEAKLRNNTGDIENWFLFEAVSVFPTLKARKEFLIYIQNFLHDGLQREITVNLALFKDDETHEQIMQQSNTGIQPILSHQDIGYFLKITKSADHHIHVKHIKNTKIVKDIFKSEQDKQKKHKQLMDK